MAKKNYNCIDAARLLCALLVIMIHISPVGTTVPGTRADLLRFALQDVLARLAVPFFFVSSGFFLFRKTGDGPSASGAERIPEPVLLYAKRILRLYLVWTVLYLPLIVRNLLLNETGPAGDVLFLIRDTVFSGSIEFLWYLPASAFAVLLTGALLRRGLTPDRILLCALVFYLAGLPGQSWFGVIAPLEGAAPAVWSFLRALQNVIVTTRDGLFDAFLFVSMGMLFAKKTIRIPRAAALAGFAGSLLLLFTEAFTLRSAGSILRTDLYLSLVPAVFFGFSLVLSAALPDRPVYPLLRHVSALVYFTHYWVGAVLMLLIGIAAPESKETPLRFFLTAPLTLLLSFILVKLSETKRFAFLKKLYA